MREEVLMAVKDRIVNVAARMLGLRACYVGGALWSILDPRQDEVIGYLEYRSDRAYKRWEAGRLPDGTNDPPLVRQFDHVTDAVKLVA